MGNGNRKEIIHHLTEEELDKELRSADDPKMVSRLGFIKNLYKGDSISEAADRVGRSQPTGNRWADRWNDGGVEGLKPDYGGGRPSKLDEDERERLRATLKDGEPWTTQEIRHLIKQEFDVSYHPNYIYELLESLGMNYAKPRTKRPERPDDAEKILESRIDKAVDDDDEPVTDGGYVVGFSTRRGHSRRTTADESGRSTSPK